MKDPVIQIEQLREELVDHPAVRVDGSHPLAERLPAIAVRVDHVLLRHERTLIQERPAAALMRPWTQEIAMQQAWEAALGLDGQRGGAAGA